MMKIDIIIPTCKPEVNAQIEEIKRFNPEINIIATCQQMSASRNRNRGLQDSESDLVIMMDDDMTGFYEGWIDDLLMLWTDDMVMMSARLLEPDRSLAYMLSENNDLSKPIITIEKGELPTACIMFKNDGTRFDNQFIGSGFEDNDFCLQLQEKYPEKRFVINNKCQLIHNNEKKNQGGKYWNHNKLYFNNKWGLSR